MSSLADNKNKVSQTVAKENQDQQFSANCIEFYCFWVEYEMFPFIQ